MKQQRHSLVACCIVASVLATGCAATNYGRLGVRGGYTETRIDENHYSVTFHGNGLASKERVWYFWIYRCAELTKSKGFTHFDIDSAAKTSRWVPANEGWQYRPAQWNPPAAGDDVRAVKAAYIYIPAAPAVPKWSGSAVIAMYNEPMPPELRRSFRAQSILDDLAPFVRSQGKEPPPSRDTLLRRAYTPGNPSPSPQEPLRQPDAADLSGAEI